MASVPPPLRVGREGAGRGGGPASWAVLRWALASSCLYCECGSPSEWVSPRWRAVADGRWAWVGCFRYRCLLVPTPRPLAGPFPGGSAEEMGHWALGPGYRGLMAPCIPAPCH